MSQNVWAVVPVKAFAGAKQRLALLLSPAQRRALATAMLEDVLAALIAAPLAGIVVSTLDPTAQALAEAHGARVVTQGAGDGHSGAVAAAARLLAAEGAPGMLTCPGDIPGITAAEVGRLLAVHGPAPAFTIVPAHDELGSNAVLLSPPDLMTLRFGNDSFLPHLEAARRQGLAPRIVRAEGIALDLDNPADARAFMNAAPARGTRALGVLQEFIR